MLPHEPVEVLPAVVAVPDLPVAPAVISKGLARKPKKAYLPTPKPYHPLPGYQPYKPYHPSPAPYKPPHQKPTFGPAYVPTTVEPKYKYSPTPTGYTPKPAVYKPKKDPYKTRLEAARRAGQLHL